MKLLHHLLKKKIFLLSFLFATSFLFVNNVFGQSPPTIQTEFPDYPPGSIVKITGSGWDANGDSVTLQVLHAGDIADNATSGAHAPWKVKVNPDGTIESAWTVPLDEDEAYATLLLTANQGSLSAEWTFTDVPCPAPNISSQPQDATRCAGTSVTFSVTATASNGGTLSYQWQTGSPAADITGATSSSYTISNPAISDAGAYKVIVTETSGCGTGTNTKTSSTATLTVNPPSVGGSVTPNQTICSGDKPANITLSGYTGDIVKWQKSTSSDFSTGVDDIVHTSAVLSGGIIGALSVNTYFRAVVKSGECTEANSSAAMITVSSGPATPGSISGLSSVCSGATGVAYSVSAVTGATSYNWTLPTGASIASGTGTNSITVDFGTTSGDVSVTASSSCGTSSASILAVTVNPNLPVSVSIGSSDGDNTICAGTSVTFTATPTNGGSTPSYQWKLNNVNVGSNQATYITSGLANGDEVKVVLTSSEACTTGNPATSNIITTTVIPNAAITSVTGGTSPLCIGGTTSVTANGVVSGGGTGAWSSSQPSVATVDGSGNVTAVGAGTTNITYTITGGCGGIQSAYQSITVLPNAAITSVTGGTSPLCIGGTTSVTANGVVSGGGTGAWSSSNTSVATVDGSGNVTAVGAGTTNITYTITGGCGGTQSAYQSITVLPNAAITSVTGGTSPLCIGGTTSVTANGVVSGGGTGAWSSSNTSVATVDGSGNVTAVGAGTTNITYTITGGCGGTQSAYQSITVLPNAAVTSVSGTPSSICPGEKTTYIANGVVLGGGTGSWSSSNTGVATVNSSGEVTGVSQGTANIIYTITGGCGGTVSKQTSVTVKAPTVVTDHLINGVTNTKSITIVYGCTTPTLKVTATGQGLLFYKWFVNTTNSNSGGTQIPLQILSSYTIPPASGVGTYYYYAEVKSVCGTVASDVFTVIITPQPANPDLDADTYYTGPNIAWTSTSTSNTATVTLSAFLRNSTFAGAECGDISTARVTFKLNGTNIPSATNLPVNFVDPNNPAKGGTAAAIVQLSISGTASSEIHEITVVISGNYKSDGATGTVDEILVGKLIPGGAIGGGAKLTHLYSTGFIKGSLLKRATATFGVEYLIKGKNVSSPKGRVTIMVPSYNDKYGNPTSDLHWYFVKSNAIASLAITSPTATFTSKANVAEYFPLTETFASIEGNCTMVVDMGDYSPSCPNFLDKVGVTVYRNAGGVWYSNNWVNTKTVMTNIFGGDVSVTGTTSATTMNNTTRSGKMEVVGEVKPFNIKAYPNPSEHQFTLVLDGATNEKISVVVYDAVGRQVKKIEKGDNLAPIRFGEELKAGAYIVEVRQGNNRKTLKLVKQ